MSTGSDGRSGGALARYIEARLAESDHIDTVRQHELFALADALADAIAARLDVRSAVDMVFICTHNARRSQFGQVWAAVAAEHFALTGVRTWSGGTEATAIAPPAVAALSRAGLQVDQKSVGPNPIYLIGAGGARRAMRCWSKRFDDPRNPRSGFFAVMTCSVVDEACPAVVGAAQRCAITYEDPGLHDGTPHEAAAYDSRCRQIAREMLFVFERLAAR